MHTLTRAHTQMHKHIHVCTCLHIFVLCMQNIPKNKKKGKESERCMKHNVIDDIPMDIIKLLARNLHERWLMTRTNSLENSHTRPKITSIDCVESPAKDSPIDTSAELDTNFQISLASESKSRSPCRVMHNLAQRLPMRIHRIYIHKSYHSVTQHPTTRFLMLTFENHKCRMHFKYMHYTSHGLPFSILRSYVALQF
jgi:hypothetical protein